MPVTFDQIREITRVQSRETRGDFELFPSVELLCVVDIDGGPKKGQRVNAKYFSDESSDTPNSLRLLHYNAFYPLQFFEFVTQP